MREFEWDPRKSAANEYKHGVSFGIVAAEFDWSGALYRSTDEHGERRIIGLGLLGERLRIVVYTMREGRRRIISCRAARKGEVEIYEQEKADRRER